MKPSYLKIVKWSDEDNVFIGSIPDLCGDCCHGDSELDVYKQLIDIEQSWIEIYQRDGKPFPQIRTRPMMELA